MSPAVWNVMELPFRLLFGSSDAELLRLEPLDEASWLRIVRLGLCIMRALRPNEELDGLKVLWVNADLAQEVWLVLDHLGGT